MNLIEIRVKCSINFLINKILSQFVSCTIYYKKLKNASQRLFFFRSRWEENLSFLSKLNKDVKSSVTFQLKNLMRKNCKKRLAFYNCSPKSLKKRCINTFHDIHEQKAHSNRKVFCFFFPITRHEHIHALTHLPTQTCRDMDIKKQTHGYIYADKSKITFTLEH